MLNLRGKKIAVLGLNRSGLDMVRVLAKAKAEVVGYAIREPAEAAAVREAVQGIPCRLVFERPQPEDFLGYDGIVDTPGGSAYHDLLRPARERGAPIFSDMDFALRFMTAPLIAVTGTNGKSSTVAMIDMILRRAGLKTMVMGGDFAHWSKAIEETGKVDYYIVEVSSRRLEHSHSLKPKYAVLLNLFPAHGERHRGGLPAYYDSKAKIFQNQDENDFLILDGNSPPVAELVRLKGARSRLVKFGPKGPFPAPSVAIEGKNIVWMPDEWNVETYSLEKAGNRASTHLLNLMAAISVAKLCGVKAEAIQPVVERFSGLPHRMQFVRRLAKVYFYDDTRSTNPGATVWGLLSFLKPVIWISGGVVASETNLEAMAKELRARVKVLLAVGRNAARLKDKLGGAIPVIECPTLKDAVHWAIRNAGDSDHVVFSPGFPADMTDSEMDRKRGPVFQKLVKSLSEWDRVLPKKK